MVYKKQFVASVKCNGQILRESGEEVFLPFGSQYSILLKNLSTVKCCVKIFIDGVNVLDNLSLLMGPGETKEIERFIKNRNLNAGNKFKFIEKTEQIEAFRGNQLEDGLIRVEYQFEKPRVPTSIFQPYYQPPRIWGNPEFYNHPQVWYSTTSEVRDGAGPQGIASVDNASLRSSRTLSKGVSMSTTPINDAGITVAGEKSDQQFSIVNDRIDYEPESHSIILKLVGVSKNIPIEKPITVKDNPVCTTCGCKNKFGSKFCNQCGTSLSII